ncbi:MAG: twin-arginine translocase TatA/TatE family subunit [Planctomycetes bacterium]|nr:twin-arginine translocase TatA/TatE family subunit [Planctomycetota bacterium]
MSCVLVAFLSPSPVEMLVVAAFALLLYGGDLPKVARSWGKSFTEFRRSFSGIQKDINEAIYSEPEQLEYHPERTSYSDDSLPDPADASTPDDDSPDDDSPDDDSSENEAAAAKRD